MRIFVVSALLLATLSLTAQTPIKGYDLHFFMDATSLTTEGTWIPTKPKDRAAHKSETQIDCYRNTRQCIEATAEYYSDQPHVSLVYFQIAKWDENGLIATNADGVCATRTLSIGFAAKHLTDVRESKVLPDDKRKACEYFGVPANESWVFLLTNSVEWKDEREREHMK